jgi:hypothetical protein
MRGPKTSGSSRALKTLSIDLLGGEGYIENLRQLCFVLYMGGGLSGPFITPSLRCYAIQ